MTDIEGDIEVRTVAFDGSQFIIKSKRWLHIMDRHPELQTMLEAIKAAASAPDEVYLDPRGSVHLIKRLYNAQSDFLAVIVRKKGSETHLITAYLLGSKRKTRGYRRFRKLPY
ncbi:MAG: hypothetical protein HYU02_06885 [Thaumarchaeota archaeon]|nr:hypothetical protein [Nitrososphaerota archaeon]